MTVEARHSSQPKQEPSYSLQNTAQAEFKALASRTNVNFAEAVPEKMKYVPDSQWEHLDWQEAIRNSPHNMHTGPAVGVKSSPAAARLTQSPSAGPPAHPPSAPKSSSSPKSVFLTEEGGTEDSLHGQRASSPHRREGWGFQAPREPEPVDLSPALFEGRLNEQTKIALESPLYQRSFHKKSGKSSSPHDLLRMKRQLQESGYDPLDELMQDMQLFEMDPELQMCAAKIFSATNKEEYTKIQERINEERLQRMEAERVQMSQAEENMLQEEFQALKTQIRGMLEKNRRKEKKLAEEIEISRQREMEQHRLNIPSIPGVTTMLSPSASSSRPMSATSHSSTRSHRSPGRGEDSLLNQSNSKKVVDLAE